MQIIRIYAKSGGLAYSFRPIKTSQADADAIKAQYPESAYLWLR